jgi:hypothetical protein
VAKSTFEADPVTNLPCQLGLPLRHALDIGRPEKRPVPAFSPD